MNGEQVVDVIIVIEYAKLLENVKIQDHGKTEISQDMGFSCVKHAQVCGIVMLTHLSICVR